MNTKTKERENGTETTNAPHGWLVTVNASGEMSREPFDPCNSLRQLQQTVDGYIELHSLRRRYDCFCNDEGRLKGLSVNEPITVLYGHDLVCGDVAICTHDADGETMGLTDAEAVDVMSTLREFGAVEKA